MDEQGLRELIEDVRAGRLSRRRFVQMMVGLGLTAPMAAQMLTAAGVAQAQPKAPGFTPDPAGRRRPAQGPLVAGADAAEPALRHRHQGPGRRAHLLRAAGGLRPRRQPRARPGRRGAERGQRRPRQGRHLGHLEAQAGRARGTTASPSPPTTSSSTGSTSSDPATAAVTSGSYREIAPHRQARQPHRQARLHQAPALLGRRVLRPARHAHPQARLRALSRAPSRARRRPTSSRWAPAPTASSTSSRATSCAARSTPPTTSRTGPSSTRSR